MLRLYRRTKSASFDAILSLSSTELLFCIFLTH